MKHSDVSRFTLRFCKSILCMAALLTAAGCEKIFDSEGDCSVKYQVVITHTRNIVGADAFAARVNSVSLFVFNHNDGKFVTAKSEAGEKLADKNYAVEFSDQELKPGTYDMIAWCGLDGNQTFKLENGDAPKNKEDLICRLVHDSYVSQQPLGNLFHGAETLTVPAGVYGVHRIEKNIDLTKNTNKLRIILQHYSGREMNKEDFHFTVTDTNGTMNYDNSLLDDQVITYHEHSKESALVETPQEEGSRAGEITSIRSVVAEIDVARLMADRRPMLTVEVDGKDKPVLNLPLVDMLLHAKGDYAPQEYLDRQDNYNLIFYLDDAYGWYTKGGVWVNSWHVVFQDKDL